MSLWNRFVWLSPETTDRWELRIAAVGRWLVTAILMGASAGFLIWFAVTAIGDYQLSRHGARAGAIVEATAPYGDRDTQYLLSFWVDGRPDEQWVTGIGRQHVNGAVAVMVDRRDHTRIELAAGSGRWIGYAIQLVSAAVFGWLAFLYLRMDSSAYLRSLKARYRRPWR